MSQPTPPIDSEWEELFAQVREEEEQWQLRKQASSFSLFWASVEHSGRVLFRSAIAAIVLVAFGYLFSWGDKFVPFDSSTWQKPPGLMGRNHLWKRFEHQYQVIGMKKSQLVKLLGVPQQVGGISSSYSTAYYELGGFPSEWNGVEFEFSRGEVSDYKLIPATWS